MDLRRRDYMLPPLAPLRAALAPLRGAAHPWAAARPFCANMKKKPQIQPVDQKQPTVLRDSGKPGNSQWHRNDAVHLSAAVARWLRITVRHLGRLSEMFLKLGILDEQPRCSSQCARAARKVGRRRWRRGAQ